MNESTTEQLKIVVAHYKRASVWLLTVGAIVGAVGASLVISVFT